MPQIRIRTPFAAAFVGFCLVSAYLGLAPPVFSTPYHSDKGLHFVTFFILTLIFYWILETSRRRVVHITLLACTAGLSIGSEVLQAFLPNGRDFDPYDVLANVLGSGTALAMCSWYHKRMLERRRQSKHYDIVPGDELNEEDAERDLELGEGVNGKGSSGDNAVAPDSQAGAAPDQSSSKTVTEELDTWDENAEDWEEGADAGAGADAEATKRAA